MKNLSSFIIIASYLFFSPLEAASSETIETFSSYDLSTNSINTKDGNGTTTYEFDTFNQLTKVEFPNGKSVEYQYDFRNNLSALIYSDQSEVRFYYDLDNRLEKIDQKSGETLFEYDHNNNLLIKKVFPNGIVVKYGYDQDKHVDEVAYYNNAGELIDRFNYVFDENGNRKTIQKTYRENTQQIDYKYDKLNRLLEANYSEGYYEHFTYDGLGNRLTKSTPKGTTIYTYNEQNQLMRFGNVSLSYDDSGNLIKKETSQNKTCYFYDEQNRLCKVENNDNVITFEYDLFGNRISKVVNGVKTTYINDLRTPITNVLVEETEGNTTQYCYAGGIHSSEGPDGNYYYLFDSPNRNVAFLTNESGSIENQYEYKSFGELRQNIGNIDNDHLFSGQQYDQETGLIYLRNRYYDPEIGRFISVDPDPGSFFNPQTLNPYVYVLNNPINLIDLTGQKAELPPEGMVNYEVCAYDRVPLYLHQTKTGHGWQEFTYSDGTVESIGHYGLRDTNGIDYFKTDEHLHLKFPESRIQTLRFTVSEALAGKIYDATKAFCSSPYNLLKHNCIDAVKAGMDAAGIDHPDFKSFGISDPLLLRQFIQFENFKNSVQTKFSNFMEWFKSPSPGVQSQTFDNAASLHFSPMVQPDFGGVSLSKSAEMLFELSGVKGVVYDQNLGQMVFFGSQNSTLPKMNFDDLAVAIRSIYGLGIKPPHHPGVSIDPSKNALIHTVRYDGLTKGTHFGQVMFEADRLLKYLVIGVDHSGKKLKVSVPGYKSVTQRYEEAGKRHKPHSARYWFTPERIQLKQSNDGLAIVFSDVKMKVCHESEFSGAIKSDPYLQAFAKHFTDNYNAYARAFPIFQELLELGKITAIVKWIRENHIPLDLELFRNYKPKRYHTLDTTKTIATAYMYSGNLFFISGGVIYACNNQNTFFQDSMSCSELEDALLKERSSEEDFSWNFNSTETSETCSAKAISWVKTRKPGNFKRSHVDMSFPVLGNHELKFVRFYDSFCDTFSPLGYGWRMLPYSLHPWKERVTISFEDGSERQVYNFLLLQENDKQKIFKILGVDPNNNLIYSCDGCPDLIYLKEDFSSILSIKKGKSIFFYSTGVPEKEVDAHGIELYYHYKNNLLDSIEHQNGSTIEFKYENGRLFQVFGPDNTIIHYHYDTKGQLERVSNVLANIEHYRYDNDLRLCQVLDAEEHVIFEGTYDDYNRLATHRQNDLEFDHTYDLLEKNAQLSVGSHILSEAVFNDQNHLLSTSDILQDSDFTYSNNLIENKEGWEYEYDKEGNLISICDPLERKTKFSFDSYGNLSTMEQPTGNIIQYAYDEKSNLRGVYYKCALEQHAFYNINGIHLQSFNDIAYSVNYDYDEWGNLSSIQHSTGPSVKFEHNKDGLVTSTTTSMGYCIKRGYNESSKLEWINDPGGVFTTFVYDEIGRLKSISRNGKKKEYTYYPNGNVQSVIDPRGNATTYFYNHLGHLEKVIDAENIQTFIDYGEEKISFHQR